MRNKFRTLLALILCLVTFALIATACVKVQTPENPEPNVGEPYNWSFNKPYAGTPDEDMKIDGKLDEEVWQNKNLLSQTFQGKKVSWSATTHFTEKGIYIGVSATSDNMVYKTRYTSRSIINVYLCKTGTQTYNINSLAYHQGRTFVFQLDPYYCRSKSRIPYYYKATVDGELNSETTCTMTAELFLTWKDLYYTQEELGENGYPDDIQMYVNYGSEATEVLGSCLWREETYFLYDKDGYKGNVESDVYGSADGGLAATDRWSFNAENKLQTTAGRTQIIWLKDAYAKDFVFEATLKPLGTDDNGQDISLRGDRVYGRFGLITENAYGTALVNGKTSGNYSIFSADARSVTNNQNGKKVIQLQTCRQIDSFHWQNEIGLSQTVQRDYDQETLKLRIIKQGDMFYYFYNDLYWDCERIVNLQDEVYCGFYTSQGMVIEDSKFEDYSGKAEELNDELSKYVYFIDVPGADTYGTVETSAYAVAKGKEVTVSFLPKSRGVLTQITRNGEDAYDEIVSAMNEKCEYTFTPDTDVTFGATFTPFDNENLVKTVVVFKDGNDEQIKDANFEISGSNKLLFYKGTPNLSGTVIVYIPKQGVYTVDGREFVVDGTYYLRSTFNNHHEVNTSFALTDETTSVDTKGNAESVKETKSFTLYCTTAENGWGKITVNGITVTGRGTLLYNEETKSYYTETSVRRYYKTMVGENFAVDAHVYMTEVAHNNNDLAAVTVTDGNDVLAFKYNINQGGNLIIATGNSASETSVEFAISGFWWDGKQHTPAANGANGKTEMAFRIVKCGSALYLFNNDGVMRAYFNKDGIHLVNGAKIVWGSENLSGINDDIKKLFSTGNQMAVGVFTYRSSGLKAEFDLDYSSDIKDVYTSAIGYGTLSFTLDEECKLADEYPVKDGYGMGEIVQIGVDIKNARNARLQMMITDKNGTRVVDGKYDWSNDCITFTFEYSGGDTDVKILVLGSGDMGWSSEWDEYDEDRDNTSVESDVGKMGWSSEWGEYDEDRSNTTL